MGGDDRHRSLAPRGERASATIGRFMARTGQIPDCAITSPAVRAEDTLRLAMDAGRWSCPARSAETLYDEGVRGVLDEVCREPATTSVLLCVGHEPTTSEVASLLTGGSRLRVPTCTLIRIDFDIEWGEVAPGTGVLAWVVVPRLLAD